VNRIVVFAALHCGDTQLKIDVLPNEPLVHVRASQAGVKGEIQFRLMLCPFWL
jgi:hypothetical protein